jgi:hypothetical protein
VAHELLLVAVIRGGYPPPHGRGSTPRVSHLKRLRGWIVGSPMWNSFAAWLVRDAATFQHGDHTLAQVDRVPLRHPPPSPGTPGRQQIRTGDPIE